MTDEISIEGTSYVSSKRASELSAYSQDYIGQLARKGLIDCQRVGGLWYVSMNSLLEYKETGEKERPIPPQPNIPKEPESLVFFDGKEFVSASRASKLCGYTTDYVGQLARAGKILSRQVGNRWYVDRDGILAHKKEKDALLAVVQRESVGVTAAPQTNNNSAREKSVAEEAFEAHFTYSTGIGDLLPTLTEKETSPKEEIEEVEETYETHNVPIRVTSSSQKPRNTAEIDKSSFSSLKSSGGLKKKLNLRLLTGATIGVFAIVSVSMLSVFALSQYSRYSEVVNSNASAVMGKEGLSQAGAILEKWFVPEIIYRR